jgi:hypothetical protein
MYMRLRMLKADEFADLQLDELYEREDNGIAKDSVSISQADIYQYEREDNGIAKDSVSISQADIYQYEREDNGIAKDSASISQADIYQCEREDNGIAKDSAPISQADVYQYEREDNGIAKDSVSISQADIYQYEREDNEIAKDCVSISQEDIYQYEREDNEIASRQSTYLGNSEPCSKDEFYDYDSIHVDKVSNPKSLALHEKDLNAAERNEANQNIARKIRQAVQSFKCRLPWWFVYINWVRKSQFENFTIVYMEHEVLCSSSNASSISPRRHLGSNLQDINIIGIQLS